jgi:hypothetical protein
VDDHLASDVEQPCLDERALGLIDDIFDIRTDLDPQAMLALRSW